MVRAGRKRKQGKRTESGRLKRNHYPVPVYDKGSDWVQAQRARYGEHYSTALGRAYAAGLLGEEAEAKGRYDAGKRFVRLYQRFIGGSAYACPLDRSPRGENVVELTISDQQQREHDWLFHAMDSMDVSGTRPYFDQLISILHVDHGPAWLDDLLADHGPRPKEGETGLMAWIDMDIARARARIILKAAIKALDVMTPEVRSNIVAVHSY